MAAFIGGRWLICARCCDKILCQDARLDYLGFYTCGDCVQSYPDALKPLPKTAQPYEIPAWKINVASPITSVQTHDTWDTSKEVWNVSTKIWNEY